MKKLFLQNLIAVAVMVSVFSLQAFSQANTSLSNLVSPTSVNQSLIPSSDNTKDIGTSTTGWRSAYLKTTLFIGGSSSTSAIQINPNSTGKTSDLRFMEVATNGTDYVGFRAPSSISSNKIWTLPAADGSSGQVLSTNGSGTLSWISAGSGGGVGTNTINYIPKWDGTALVTGTLKDTLSSITNGNHSKKGRLTIYRNVGLFPEDGVSAVQGLGTNTLGGSVTSKGFLAAKDLNELIDQLVFPPFSSSLDHAGVMGVITPNATNDGAAVLGLNQGGGSITYGVLGQTQGTGGANYGVFGSSDCGGFVNFSAVNYGVYGKAEKATYNYALRGQATSEPGTTGYGIYASASGTGGNYAGYFASGKVYMQDILSVSTTTATARLNVKGTSETILIEGTTPYLKLVDGTNQATFVQASGNDMRIGSLSGNTNGKVILRMNGTNKDAFDVNGNLGLGTISPGCLLHLKGSNELLRLEGTDANIDFQSSGVQKAFIQRSGNDLKIVSNSGNIILGNNVTGDQLFVNSNGTVGVGSGNLLYVNSTNGTVGVGTSTPKTGYKLSVEGKIACRELKVETAAWPDYVFESNYKLLSLPELENFISTNNHLPGIPSATELEQDGISVGDMQNKLMQKVEELTLYVIDLQKQNDELKNQVDALGK